MYAKHQRKTISSYQFQIWSLMIVFTIVSLTQPVFAQSDCKPQGLITEYGLSILEKSPHGENISYGEDPLQFGELYLPTDRGPFPVVVMIHGGCWLAEFDQAHMRALAVAVRNSGYAVWNLEYRRVGNPGGGWPGTFLDVATGTDYLRELARTHPLDLKQVVVLGHSAGGHLGLWLAVRPQLSLESDVYTAEPLPLKAVLAMAPGTDIEYIHFTRICGHVMDKLIGGGPEEVPARYRDASPLARIPLGIPHTVLVGYLDGYELLGRSYYYSAIEAGDNRVRLVEAPESGHFEMIDPKTTTWPIVLEALQALLR